MNNLARAMMTDDPAERENYLNRETLKAAVMRQITCKYTGVVLDMRTAVQVTVRRDGRAIVIDTMSPDHFDTIIDNLKAGLESKNLEMEVIDGRELYKGKKG